VLDAKTVIIPNNCCPALVYGIILSGAKPAFCEVDLRSGALDPAACKRLLTDTEADIVVHIHPFGLYSNRDALYENCRQHGAFFFEDGASWFPPSPRYEVKIGSCVGLSFGWSKIFDLGGGSLLAFEDSKFAEEVEEFLRLLPPPSPRDMRRDFEQQYSAMTNDDLLHQATMTDLSILAAAFRSHWIGNRGNVVRAPNTRQVQQERRRRTELVDELLQLLFGHPVQFLQRSALDFPWRFCFLCRDPNLVRDMFSSNGFGVGRLYSALNKVFPIYNCSNDLSVSYQFAEQIYNIDMSNVTIEWIRSARKKYRINVLKRRLRPVKRWLSQYPSWSRL
jgi:hypothetical protein